MVTNEPTLLVLGAGASLAYGFPLGAELQKQIAETLNKAQRARFVADASGRSVDEVQAFAKLLVQARRSSIDAFIESRAQDYDVIGRCAIAQHLLQLESQDKLFPPLKEDWYAVLFDAILGNSPEAFCRNQLKVITFNFDRSFERALFLALEANFADDADVRALLQVVPVLHVHGDLGEPSWLGTSHGMRAYAPEQHDAVKISECAKRIKIVHHGITDGTEATIREWFDWCRRVYFIGFSYHELNLRKLGIPNSLKSKSAAVGTTYGMGDGMRGRVRRLTDNLISMVPFEWSAVDAIRNYGWFYEG